MFTQHDEYVWWCVWWRAVWICTSLWLYFSLICFSVAFIYFVLCNLACNTLPSCFPGRGELLQRNLLHVVRHFWLLQLCIVATVVHSLPKQCSTILFSLVSLPISIAAYRISPFRLSVTFINPIEQFVIPDVCCWLLHLHITLLLPYTRYIVYIVVPYHVHYNFLRFVAVFS